MQMQILKYKCNQVSGQLVLTAASNQTHPSNLNLQLPWKKLYHHKYEFNPKNVCFCIFWSCMLSVFYQKFLFGDQVLLLNFAQV